MTPEQIIAAVSESAGQGYVFGLVFVVLVLLLSKGTGV